MADACHEPEWRVWEDVELPERKVRISRVIGYASDFIAQPERAADRLLRSDSNVDKRSRLRLTIESWLRRAVKGAPGVGTILP
jgi:hypothetical protein